MSTPKDKAPAEPTKPMLSYDECHTIALESVGPRDSAETVRDIYERDRAKLIETLQEMIDSIKEMRGGAKGMFEGIRYGNLIEDDSLYLSLCLRRFDKLLDRAKDIGITPDHGG